MKLREVDLLRGIAIFFMIIANYSPYYLDNPHYLLRFFYTFAAPIFVTITGFLMFRNKINKDYDFRYYLSRGIIILMVGALVDLSYSLMPFLSWDVLYLIGFCTITFLVLYKLWNILNYWSIIIFFILTVLCQLLFGYNGYAQELELSDLNSIRMDNFIFVSLRQFFIDGYFPFFPWCGIFMLGFALNDENYKKVVRRYSYIFVFIFVLFSYFLINSVRYIRQGYAELFYPPDWVFIVWAWCFVSLVFVFVNFNNRYFELIGKSSLFFYVFHLLFIEHFPIKISKLIFNKYYPYFDLFVVFSFTLIIIGLIALVFEKIKKKIKNIPFILKFIIGT